MFTDREYEEAIAIKNSGNTFTHMDAVRFLHEIKRVRDLLGGMDVEDVLVLMRKYQDDRAQLTFRLREINTHTKQLQEQKTGTGYLNKKGLHTEVTSHEVDCEGYDGPEYSEEWGVREKVKFFSEETLYAITRRGYVARNVVHHLSKIKKISDPLEGEPPTLDYYSSHTTNDLRVAEDDSGKCDPDHSSGL